MSTEQTTTRALSLQILNASLFFVGGVAAFVASEWTARFYLAGSSVMVLNAAIITIGQRRPRPVFRSRWTSLVPLGVGVFVLAAGSFAMGRWLAIVTRS